MLGHIALNVALAHPVKCALPEVLSIDRARDVGTPLLDVGVLSVGELRLARSDEGAGVDRVE